jgi:hypothetical protein
VELRRIIGECKRGLKGESKVAPSRRYLISISEMSCTSTSLTRVRMVLMINCAN